MESRVCHRSFAFAAQSLSSYNQCLRLRLTLGKVRDNSTSSLPFAYDSIRIPESVTPQVLLQSYEELYFSAQRTVDEMFPDLIRPPLEGLTSVEVGKKKANISYNFAMTTRRMMICPRRSEGAMIPTTSQATVKQIGPIVLNGTLLAGTLMVKTEEEWDALRGIDGSKRLEGIIGEVGIPHKRQELMSPSHGGPSITGE